MKWGEPNEKQKVRKYIFIWWKTGRFVRLEMHQTENVGIKIELTHEARL